MDTLGPTAQTVQPLSKPVYSKATPTLLREAGFDERWLQDRVEEDPSILGIGDLTVLFKEKQQSAGGRIDFLLEDPDTGMMFEVEIMLGRLNESHIIRTIEYWDLERRRYPSREHRAVIVAEDITNRFFNVIALLHRSVPIIALQLDALLVEGKLTLNFTKVLDVFETAEEEEPVGEQVDRGYWEKKSTTEVLRIVDNCLGELRNRGIDSSISFNKSRISAAGGSGQFAWFRPRKSHCHLITIGIGEQPLDHPTVQALMEAGITVTERKRGRIGVTVTQDRAADALPLLGDLLVAAYEERQS